MRVSSVLIFLGIVLTTGLAGQQSPAGVPDYGELVTGTNPVSRRVVRLNVPLVRQAGGPLCGPAAIEMLFRFWGERRHSQYDIARALVLRFQNEGRYRDSAVLAQIRAGGKIDWRTFPGTGTYYLREFLVPIAPTRNPRVRSLPADPTRAGALRDRFFRELKGHLDAGVPVIVHQWYDARHRSQHYRVVTGYDDVRGLIFLNDPQDGRLEMSDERFLDLWRVEEDWLPYNYIVFNAYAPGQVKAGALRVDLGGRPPSDGK